jgi:phosphoglucomutase/phosphomannomutase
VRRVGASAGIVVSASHNPRTDNGFKAYGPSGGQLAPPLDQEVMEAVRRASEGAIAAIPFEEGLSTGAIRVLGPDADEAYLQAVLDTGLTQTRGTRIVYTALHGAGTRSVVPVLTAAGFRDLNMVRSQESPDGSFPNIADNIPNPEEPSALAEAGETARLLDADIAIGTDPDADRLGCVAKRHGPSPAWRPLTGNQIGAILCHHVLSELLASRRVRPDTLVLTTAVTSPMIGKIARRFGANVIEDLLVGFKYIAAVTESLSDPGRIAFACEESHGYLGGAYTRDKDGAGAALLLAEAAATDRAIGRGLWDRLAEIHQTVGYHCDLLHAFLSPGKSGMAHVARMLTGLRSHPPCRLGGLDVVQISDRLDNTVRDATGAVLRHKTPTSDPVTGQEIAALLPARDNLLIYELRGDCGLAGARAAVRPSGTEPKCKVYASGWAAPQSGTTAGDVDAVTTAIREELLQYALSIA